MEEDAMNVNVDDELEQAIEDVVMTGIENMLNPALVKKTLARRAAVRQAVLSEQDLQCHYDADGLAMASMRYSKVAAQRSYQIGLMQQSC